jgi:AraC-like DNA-binding protein
MTINYPSRKRSPENQDIQKRDVNASQRAVLAVQLRAQKVKYDEIAKACGYGSAGAAHKAVMRELQRTISTNVEELRREELDSLERLELKCWQRLDDKTYGKGMLFAVDRILAIKERRARLMGLDTPVDVAQNNNLVVIREVPQNYLGVEAVKEA